MKPSLRIQQIADEMCRQADNEMFIDIHIGEKAIIKYLDEEYERNKPCEHLQINTRGGTCSKCGYSVSFVGKQDHCCVCARACGHTVPTNYCELHRLIRARYF